MFLRANINLPELQRKIRSLQTARGQTDGRRGIPHLELRVYVDEVGRPLYPGCEIVCIEGGVEHGSGYSLDLERIR